MVAKKTILIDADVVSHFASADELDTIHLIFPHCKLCMLDVVHQELQNWPNKSVLTKVSLVLGKGIKLMDFPNEHEEIKREYFWIKKTMYKGAGESACLAVARYNDKIIASSNLTDIKNYCVMHKIVYLTTMDFLCEAVRIGLFDEARCDAFISKVIAKSKLPVKKMSEHKCRSLEGMPKPE